MKCVLELGTILLVLKHLNSTDLEWNWWDSGSGILFWNYIRLRGGTDNIAHSDSDCYHETVFITLVLSTMLDDVENHTIGARQPHSKRVWKAFDSGFHCNE